MTLVLKTAEGGTFESRHNCLGGGHILATVAHNLDMLGLRWWLVANCVACWMETSDKTAERLEMAAVKVGNHTLAAEDIDQCVSQIDCRCLWQFMNHYPKILNCRYCIVAPQFGHHVEPCTLSSVEILSSTCSLWPKIVINYCRCEMWGRMNWSMVEYTACSSDLLRKDGLLISHSVVTNCGVSLHLRPMKPIRALRTRNLNRTHPACLCYMLKFIY